MDTFWKEYNFTINRLFLECLCRLFYLRETAKKLLSATSEIGNRPFTINELDL